MNLDARSARSNTEVGLVIDSPEVANDIERLVHQDDFESMYRLRLSADGKDVEWVSNRSGKEVAQVDEPNSDWWGSFKLWLMALFIAEDML